MTLRLVLSIVVLNLAWQWPRTIWAAAAAVSQATESRYKIEREDAHPWRAPFALERVGRPIVVVLTPTIQPEPGAYALVAYANGTEVNRQTLVPERFPAASRVVLRGEADELVLWFTQRAGDAPVELARQKIAISPLEAEAIARTDVITNPVDLGTVLVPSGWLLLESGQSATLEAAAIAHGRDWPDARLIARYESSPGEARSMRMPLSSGVRRSLVMKLPRANPARDRDVLSVLLDDGQGRDLWRKSIPVMSRKNGPSGRVRCHL